MISAIKFTVAPLSLAFFAYLSFTQRGVLTYSAFLYAYAMIPLIEFFLINDERNFSEFEESLAKKYCIRFDTLHLRRTSLGLIMRFSFLFARRIASNI
ncbi:MAG: hypothetical protein CM15mP23_06940 [Cryomorphaceae bacterium]|nr:MAG: hypothetical protein CM15mP23_06940 [Cryomorphaceae bacterium]